MTEPSPKRASSTIGNDETIEVFARELLRAFDAAEGFAKDRGGVTSQPESRHMGPTAVGMSWTSRRSSSAASSFISSEKSRRQLQTLYQRCIRDAVDDLCDLLCTEPALRNASRQRRIDAALVARENTVRPIRISADMLVRFLEDVTNNFHEQHDSLGRSVSSAAWVSDWNPAWRTQNLVWTLLKRLGSTTPPPGPLVEPFQSLKESAFACLFQGDYLARIRRKCSFKESIAQYVPHPGQWGADFTWVGAAVFISMPIASLAHSWDEGNRLVTFWGIFVSLFAGISIILLLLFASYRSRYSNEILDKAAKGTQYERGRGDGAFTVVSMRPSRSASTASISTAQSTDDRIVENDSQASTPEASGQVGGGSPSQERTGSVLQLYQASMFVERIYGSTYIDESWMIGMTEQQLYDAVLLVLQTAGALGRQTAAFSFTSLAIATRGTPDPDLFASGTISAAVQGSQVSFAIFSFLGALAFSCGMMSAILTDLIVRQMAFTQVKAEGTTHAFVKKFGFFIRIVGSLNSYAGMSLFTGVVVLLLSIFRVHPVAVFPLGAAWLILGSITIDSFFTKFHFWNMSEIIHDVGEVIDDPDIQSPSPVYGTLQLAVRTLKNWIGRGREWSRMTKENKSRGKANSP